MSEQTAVPASPPPPPPKPLSLGETLAKRKAELEQVIVAAQTAWSNGVGASVGMEAGIEYS